MNHIDNFLKKLKTDRNTFATYVLTLISFYICIDRIVEIILIAATGMYVNYWGPITYTLALACPIFAFYFSFASKFVTQDDKKLSFMYIYLIGLYIVIVSMIVQWINQLEWMLLISVPNYSYIILNFMDLIKPAMSAFAWYIPIVSFYPLFKFIYMKINDTKDLRDSIFDYGGIDLGPVRDGLGPYTCEMYICKNKEDGKIIKIPEDRRFESTLVIGVSGAGKTSMIFEPMVARDLEKKYLFKEIAKEMGYTALRTGLATLKNPYTNEYINDNFSLNMLVPTQAKEKIYKAYMNKLLYKYNGESSIYKNLGITYMTPDYDSIERVQEIAENFNVGYKIIDPNNQNSIGLNPFIFDDPIKTSIAISSVLKRMYTAEVNLNNNSSVDEAFMQNISTQAIENITLLLKEMYPRLHNGDLPNLEDLLKLLTNFDLIENLSEEMKKVPELAQKYEIQISYFEKTFYGDAVGRADTAKYLQATAAQLENLLRYPGIRSILCNRQNNLNYDDALQNGEVVLVCTRRGDLGVSVHKAFGLFFLLLMQQSVLSRPGNEKSRIPHFLYIDEFPPFVCRATEDIFTLYRKYRVGTIISAQNLSQFGINNDNNYRQTILANCTTKIVFGNNTPDDNDWWQREFGVKRQWDFKNTYKTDNNGNPQYDENYRDVKWAWVNNYASTKVQSLKFKEIIIKTKDIKGKNILGTSKVDFLEEKYKQKQKVKTYNFDKFTNGILNKESDPKKHKMAFDLTDDAKARAKMNLPYGYDDVDPVKDNNANLKYKFDNEDPIVNYNNKNNNKK